MDEDDKAMDWRLLGEYFGPPSMMWLLPTKPAIATDPRASVPRSHPANDPV